MFVRNTGSAIFIPVIQRYLRNGKGKNWCMLSAVVFHVNQFWKLRSSWNTLGHCFFFFSGCKSVEFFCVLKGVKVLEGWYESPPVSLTQYHLTYSRPIFSLRKVYIIIAHQHVYHWDKTNNTLLTNRDSCFNPFTAKDVYFTVTKAWTCIFHTTVTDVCIVLYFLNASKQS